MAEERKDVLLVFKSTKKGKDSKDADRLQLYMSVEEVTALIKEFKEVATERGVILDVHTGYKISKSGTKFLSSYAFARGIQEPRTQESFAASAGTPEAETSADKIAALKGI